MTRLDGAYAAMQAELDDITHKIADNEALELRHAISIAHWCGIAQGVVSREASGAARWQALPEPAPATRQALYEARDQLRTMFRRWHDMSAPGANATRDAPTIEKAILALDSFFREPRSPVVPLPEAHASGDACVLEMVGAAGLNLLHAWLESPSPLQRLIAQAELFRRGEGPDPRETIGKGTSG